MDKTKLQLYEELYKKVQEDYHYRSGKTLKDSIYVTECEYCKKQINLWSYWQGSLDADILLVGQDWGSFKPNERLLDKRMLENIEKMDAGESADYFEGIDDTQITATDKHIIKLFAVLGDEYADIRKKHPKLFFTNLCLGYRNEGYTGNLQKEWLRNDLKYLTGFNIEESNETKHISGLVEIVAPKVILCLGKDTYEEVASALNGSKVRIKNFYKSLDEHKNHLDVKFNGQEMRIYALAHPGGRGTANRKMYCTVPDKQKSGIELQFADWCEVAKYL